MKSNGIKYKLVMSVLLILVLPVLMSQMGNKFSPASEQNNVDDGSEIPTSADPDVNISLGSLAPYTQSPTETLGELSGAMTAAMTDLGNVSADTRDNLEDLGTLNTVTQDPITDLGNINADTESPETVLGYLGDYT